MALVDTVWYTNFGNGTSTGYYAVTVRPQNTAVAAGVLRRQFTAPSVGNERVFVCIIAGTTANVTDATWVLTRGAKTTDGTATWMECTGQAALNGDLTNTATWAQVKAATPAVLGQIIKRSNNASYQICTTAGAMSASEPTFSDTAGVTTTDTTAVWTSLGAVSNFAAGGLAPHARLANVLAATWFASGNTVYVGDNHAETQATNISTGGSSALMARILCHNHSGSYPPASGDLTTGATITTTSNAAIQLNMQGSFYFYGLTFSATTTSAAAGILAIGATSVGQVQNWYYFDNCSLRIGTNTVNASIQLGPTAAASWSVIVFDNTTVKFAATSQFLQSAFAQFSWRNTGQVLASGSSVPATLFQPASSGSNLSVLALEGLDLSQLTGSLYANTPGSSIGSLTIKDCKLNAAVTITQPINTGQVVQFSRSDSGATAYKSSRSTYEGIESTETSIVRSGGYADPTGQVQSRKLVTSANTQWLRPYKAQPLSVWNSAVGSSKTVTVYGTVNAGALPSNDDIWMEVSYLGSGSSPLGSTATSGKAQVWSANAAVPSDGSNWSTPAFTTFDGLTSNVVMSNGNLTATLNPAANSSGVFSTANLVAGKYYFEVTSNTASPSTGHCVGIATPTATFGNLNSGGIAGAVAFMATGGVIYVDNVNSTKTIGTTAPTDVIGVAVDLTNHLIWFRRNAGNWNGDAAANPATGAGGVSLAGTNLSASSRFAPYIGYNSTTVGWNATANFGQSAYANAAPSGFGNWSGWVPFKLSTTVTPQLPGYIVPVIKAAKAGVTYYIDPAVTVT